MYGLGQHKNYPSHTKNDIKETMADIANPTSNATLYDEDGNQVGVTLNVDTGLYELNVRIDDEIRTSLASPHSYQELGQYYSAVAGGTLANKNETAIIWWNNPVASGMDLEFYDFDMGTPNNITFIFRLYLNPTVTVNGTAYTPNQLNTGSTNTSDALVYTLPTATSFGDLVDIAVVTIGTLRLPVDFGISIDEGDSCLVTMQASSANNDYFLSIKWAEDSD